MPEDHSRSLFLNVVQVELLAKPAVIPLLSLFKPVQISVLIFFPDPGCAIYPLQHFITRITSPVGARYLHQLENLDLGCCRYMWAPAQIGKVPLRIQRHVLISRNSFNDLCLVVLSLVLKKIDRFRTLPHLTLNLQVPFTDLCHTLFNRRKVFCRERSLVREVIIKTILNYRPNGDLRFGKQFLDRMCQQVRAGMTNDLQSFRILFGNDRQITVRVDTVRHVHELAIDLAGQRCTHQPRTDGCRNLHHRYRLLKFTLRTIRQTNDCHRSFL